MNWAFGITTANEKLVAEVRTGGDAVRLLELEQLVTEGVPSIRGLPRKNRLVTNFCDWKTTSPNDYIEAYGLDNAITKNSNHQMFEFQVRDTCFQVPALVLMRALFYPSKHLLPTMFRPQALDDLGFLDGEELHLDETRTRGGYKWANEPVKSRLRWMYAFPSANRMAHSIHEHAMRGVVGLTLPDAVVRLVIAGKKVGNTYYVAEMNVTKIVAQESGFASPRDLPSNIIEIAGSSAKVADDSIPLRGDNVTLSDEEWEAIEPILLAQSNHRFLLSQRYLFDCILTKLHTGTPWRKSVSKNGTYNHASQAYRVWKERGTFFPALEQLERMRCGS